MRLIHSTKIDVHSFSDNKIPAYAILSHTWGADDEEVTLNNMRDGSGGNKKGFQKIEFCAKEAAANGIEWIWVDTCCIDKKSSAELTEAINSMYKWYKKAEICYVYLEDVKITTLPLKSSSEFSSSRWFTRGWTLQELIAPSHLEFFGQNWERLGSKKDHVELLSTITRIDVPVLKGRVEPSAVTVAKRMFWAANRHTTRVEDIAYCLMGIFQVNMPLIYGEDERAFIRLQEEIMKRTDDRTLYAWVSPPEAQITTSGLLAKSPSWFEKTGHFAEVPSRSPHLMTSKGISIELELYAKREEEHFQNQEGFEDEAVYYAVLDCAENSRRGQRFILSLKCILADSTEFVRVNTDVFQLPRDFEDPANRRSNKELDSSHYKSFGLQTVYVRQAPLKFGVRDHGNIYGFMLNFNGLTEGNHSFDLIKQYPPMVKFNTDSKHIYCVPPVSHGIVAALLFKSFRTSASFAILLGIDEVYGARCGVKRFTGEDEASATELKTLYHTTDVSSLEIQPYSAKVSFSKMELRYVRIHVEQNENEAIYDVEVRFWGDGRERQHSW